MDKKSKRVAIVFPGQGSQEKGMGRDVAERYSDIMELWRKSEKICRAELREIYWEGDEKEMKRTRYLQPAMVVVGLGLWYVWKKRGLGVDCMAGHSLGEYTALGASKVLKIDHLLELVSLRGRLMDEVDSQGSMAAIIKLTEEEVKGLVKEVNNELPDRILCVANFNSPSQFVVSGHVEAVERISSKVKSKRGRAVVLPVSGAFHSDLMREASDELAEFMEKLQWKDSDYPIYLNVTANPHTKGPEIMEVMKKQMTSSVLWTQLVLNQYRDNIKRWVELGPKGVLTRLIKQILKEKEDVEMAFVDGIESLNKFLNGQT